MRLVRPRRLEFDQHALREHFRLISVQAVRSQSEQKSTDAEWFGYSSLEHNNKSMKDPYEYTRTV